ncbi:PBSX family phage terminase large subunit [Bombella sp. TMW 2.2543]|uniref:PBSX family phage terminase large subunit n=1 Tax=Bombella pluederhausensis TaxID=2967336 RepID=A0ABT3WEM3_9PROT|nr:PBSX family phage terminase large subunit [Bombella pluederhausensis]MCX5617133.1 PBSX family phage terminase large subunit [Bombella pluederhausensis]
MTGNRLTIMTPRAFAPLLQPVRYKGLWGGRGSGKSHFFAGLLIEQATLRPGLRAVCIREIQKSLTVSVHQLLRDTITRLNLSSLFTVLDKEIRTPGGGVILFQGMQSYNAETIKSLEGMDIAWVEEAQSLSATSLKLLRPTIRKPHSEIWFSWNPNHPSDPVDAFMRAPAAEDDPSIMTICANWSDNPWFPDVLNQERKRDQTLRPQDYEHIWEGGYQQHHEALIFRNRITVEDFSAPEDCRFYFGVDWGFSRDPTALIRCFIQDDILHIDHEAGGTHIPLDQLPDLFDRIPAIRRWPIRADSARPETINYLKTHHHFRISAARKWPGSVEDGIERLRSFRTIRIHPRCTETAREFRLYRYRSDPLTGDVLPQIEDANNHYIDALRYALDGLITNRSSLPDFSRFAPSA